MNVNSEITVRLDEHGVATVVECGVQSSYVFCEAKCAGDPEQFEVYCKARQEYADSYRAYGGAISMLAGLLKRNGGTE